ncbi:MAG TPA: methyltransferase domain-containing protein [Hanamia sp.]|nr:methyltransferase domain-containing protein [Hanamia sp.]
MIKGRQINASHVEAFSRLLSKVNIDEAGFGSYQLTYLKHLFSHKNYYLRIYAQVLTEVLDKSHKQKADIFLVDYGAGNGLLGLFAKYCGFGKVVQVDTSKGFHESQKILSDKLNIPIAEHLHGNFEMLKKYKHEAPDALVGTDVIEHIYDLDSFFATLHELNGNMTIIFTTASNDRNPWKKKKLMHVQLKDEYEGYDAENGNDSLLPFRQVRENIIKNKLPQLSETEIHLLVKNTRGLRQDDIIKACGQYITTNEMPSLIAHPTNTCDPLSGSWTERFLSYAEYKSLFNRHGYALSIKNGFYNHYQGGIKGTILFFLNIAGKIPGRAGNMISPYIMLSGSGLKHK